MGKPIFHHEFQRTHQGNTGNYKKANPIDHEKCDHLKIFPWKLKCYLTMESEGMQNLIMPLIDVIHIPSTKVTFSNLCNIGQTVDIVTHLWAPIPSEKYLPHKVSITSLLYQLDLDECRSHY